MSNRIEKIDFSKIAMDEISAHQGRFVNEDKVYKNYYNNKEDLEIVDVDGFDDVVRIDDVSYDDKGNEVSRMGMGFAPREAVTFKNSSIQLENNDNNNQ